MTLTKESIARFKEIYERKSGHRISDEEALQLANQLLRFYAIVLEREVFSEGSS